MKASLLTRAATVAFLSAGLVAGTGMAGFAATAADTGAAGSPTTQTTNPSAGSMAGTPGAAANTMSGTSAPNATQSGQADTTAPRQTIEQMASQRLDELHSRLQINQHQTAQWNKFATVMRDNARQLDQAYQRRADRIDTMNAIDNMKSYQQIEQMRTRDMAKLLPAFQSLYATLSPPQKRDADDLFRNRSEQAQQHRQTEMQQHQAATGATH